MFQAETEDMLPRVAPKPSVNALNYNESLAKPIVPEVSILFGQQQAQQQQTAASSGSGGLCAPQSYAAWKKQVLPKVTFPAGAESSVSPTLDQNAQRTTLYPLRSTAAMTPLANASVCTTTSTNSISAQQPAATAPLGMISSTRATLLHNQQRRSLDAVAVPTRSAAIASDVLTICAGTQTEYSGNIGSSPMGESSATKDDMAQVFLLLEAMREEQQRLREVCEALLMQPMCAGAKASVLVCDAGTQYDEPAMPMDKTTRRIVPPLMQQFIAEEEAEQMERVTAASTQHVQHVQQPIYPVAQSTAYRSNTTPQQMAPPQATTMKNIGAVLAKPATEKSMVMTELALKYLPNEKLSELMHELEVSPAGIKSSAPAAECNNHAPPLRGIENLVKSPNELSNASYKYLKKYRLLPEENASANRDMAFDKRSSPISTQPKVQSPLVVNGGGSHGDNAARLEQLLDLERIRAQPKFL